MAEIESVEDALRDLGIEMPKPTTQSWSFNPRVPRTVPKSELKGEYFVIIAKALELGCPADKLVFDSYSELDRLQIGSIAFRELSARADSSAGEMEGKAMVGHTVAALQKAIAEYDASKFAQLPFTFDRCERQGVRPSMEDRTIIVPDVNYLFNLSSSEKQSFFGVFDGHAGIEAAHFTQAHLLPSIVSNAHFNSDLQLAIRESHLSVDKAFGTKGSRSGCTALSVFVRNNKAYLSWVGDSSAILCRDSKAVILMDAHKPNRADERERIEKAGGMVVEMFGVWRVNGMLSVARAIGDQSLKSLIIAEPDISVIELDGTEDFFVLACDGLWDVMKPEEVVEFISSKIVRTPSGAVEPGIAELLTDHAISLDNVSVVLAFTNRPGAAGAGADAGAGAGAGSTQ